MKNLVNDIANDVAEKFAKQWIDKMDDVFERHMGKNVDPYELTNTEDVLAILLGMGEAHFRVVDQKMHLIADQPVSVHWTGEKFKVYINKGSKNEKQ